MITTNRFRKTILNHFDKAGRAFPWRETTDPYKILVSEIMLQQTQASRVVSKYEAFVKRFRTIKELAGAEVSEVLKLWIGLGYNRRALALRRLAEVVMTQYRGKIPDTHSELLKLPGVGPYTAGAILAFAFNKPLPLIETNIRTVYIHFFFPKRAEVSDRELMPLIEKTLSHTNPREWYWALMDYGAMLKEQGLDRNKQSRHYLKQSTFKGSNREVRGKILRLLSRNQKLTQSELSRYIADSEERVPTKLRELCAEGFVVKKGRDFMLA